MWRGEKKKPVFGVYCVSVLDTVRLQYKAGPILQWDRGCKCMNTTPRAETEQIGHRAAGTPPEIILGKGRGPHIHIFTEKYIKNRHGSGTDLTSYLSLIGKSHKSKCGYKGTSTYIPTCCTFMYVLSVSVTRYAPQFCSRLSIRIRLFVLDQFSSCDLPGQYFIVQR